MLLQPLLAETNACKISPIGLPFIGKELKYDSGYGFCFYRVVSLWGTAVARWLRYCATNQKVAGSIPDGVIEFFIDINSSDRTMTLGSTQPLIEMSTGSISWG
jgi:hypothetical protein